MRAVSSFGGLALMWFGLAPWCAMAGTPTPATSPTASSQGTDQVAGLGKRVDTATLQKLSGGSDVIQKMMLTGTVSNNQSDHLLTGDNALNGSSFNGAAGLNSVIQNTGNGVLIQNATIVNVQVQP